MDSNEKNKKRKKNDSNGSVDDDPNSEENYLDHRYLPVVFHNLKGYDAHFILKDFKKQYTKQDKGGGKSPT